MRKKYNIIALILFTSGLFISCGNQNQSAPASGFGGLSVQIVWPEASPTLDAPTIMKAAPTGVITMRFVVSGAGMTTMQQDFDASAGQGTITGVPVGSGRTLTIQGLNSTSAVIYEGSKSSVTVSEGQVTPCGTVTMTATGSSVATSGYTDNGNGTVKANATGLIWQKKYDGTMRTWNAANSYCAGLSLAGSGWRLPTIDELKSLIDTTQTPKIDPIFTTSKTLSDNFWSSTAGINSAGVVNFNNGWSGDQAILDITKFYVLCVR